jgi:hypothetical protein
MAVCVLVEWKMLGLFIKERKRDSWVDGDSKEIPGLNRISF